MSDASKSRSRPSSFRRAGSVSSEKIEFSRAFSRRRFLDFVVRCRTERRPLIPSVSTTISTFRRIINEIAIHIKVNSLIEIVIVPNPYNL